jgi:uncharacterized protein (DUF4415 family)
MTDLAKQTPKQRAHYHYMAEAMRRLEWDLHNTIEMTGHIPEAWHEIAQEAPEQATVHINLRVDADVVRFFKSMGAGYGPRINAVLKSYMHARIAGVIRGADTINHYKRREEDWAGRKPAFGSVNRMLGREWQDAPWPDEHDAARAVVQEAYQQRYAVEGTPEGGAKPV